MSCYPALVVYLYAKRIKLRRLFRLMLFSRLKLSSRGLSAGSREIPKKSMSPCRKKMIMYLFLQINIMAHDM